MKKKIVILSAMVAILIVIGGLSPTIVSKDLKMSSKGDTITAEVNRYYGFDSEPIHTELTLEEAEEIKQILINLNEAIENNDEEAIDQYELILNEKGIFGEDYQEFFSYNTYAEKMKSARFPDLEKYLGDQNGDNISNLMCYFNALGKGIMLFTIGLRVWAGIKRAVENASSPLAGFILLLALIPFLVLVILITHIIPFRILLPVGHMEMKDGRISSLGLMGFKDVKVVEGEERIAVNVSWFTGITLNLPFGENPFLFTSGIALRVEESILL